MAKELTTGQKKRIENIKTAKLPIGSKFPDKICIECGEPFPINWKCQQVSKVYCSNKCAQSFNKKQKCKK